MKKILIMFAVGTLILLFSIGRVNASGSCTALLDGPQLKAGVERSTSKYSLMSEYNTATGSRAKTYFSNYNSLSNSFVSWNSRKLTVVLMEDDGPFNANDKVKTYIGTFNGKTLSEMSLKTTHISGNIESTNDSISELYITAKISKHDNDPSTYSRGIFDYQLCQE